MTDFIIFNSHNFPTIQDLEAHLTELRLFGGTPDCWSSESDLETAIEEAKKHFEESSRLSVYVVSELEYKIEKSFIKQAKREITEIITDYVDDLNYCHIDVYFSDDENETGTVVALVCLDTNKVVFHDNIYRTNERILEAIKEAGGIYF